MASIPQVAISNLAKANAGQLNPVKPNNESGNVFEKLLRATNNEQHVADNAIRDFIEGKEGTNIQQVVMAVSQAEMSFQFFMEVRNQLIDSYSELMRMQF